MYDLSLNFLNNIVEVKILFMTKYYAVLDTFILCRTSLLMLFLRFTPKT